MAKAKSGLTAVRQTWEDWLIPPIPFTIGATSYTSSVRDGKGQASAHIAISNTNAFTLLILQAWQSAGNFVQTLSVVAAVDPITGLYVADVVVPISRRFIKFQVTNLAAGGLSTAFEAGAYLMPRADSTSSSSSGGGGGGSAVANRGAFATNQMNVAVPLTAVQLLSQAVPSGFAVSIIAKKANTKNIYLGTSAANAANHAVADILGPGDTRKLYITNWNLVWMDADIAAEGVTIISEA